MSQLRLNQTKISPYSHRLPSFFEPIPCASLHPGKRVLRTSKRARNRCRAEDARRCVGKLGSASPWWRVHGRFKQGIPSTDSTKPSAIPGCMRPAGMSSPMRCRMSGQSRMSGQRQCMRSGCHTSRSRFSSPATRKNPINPFPNTPSRAAIEKECGCRGIVPAVVAVSAIGGLLALFSIELDARRYRQRQGLARRRGARSVRRGGTGASAGFGAATAARRSARSA